MNNEENPQPTHHAMLVAWGVFAQCLGLIEQLEAIPLRQKSVDHSPQSKVIEFLVANLAGLAHLKEVSLASHPLDQDRVVAEAWGQTGWADYSGVSRTLAALNQEETEAILQVLGEISAPFLDREVTLALQRDGRLVLDGDLSGRPVSDTSQTYPQAAFGHMDDQVHLGYQAALVSLQSPTYGRLWLSVSQHPGDTVSCTEAEPMLKRSEAILGRRPRRRVELLARRLEGLEHLVPQLEAGTQEARQCLEKEQGRLSRIHQEVALSQTNLAALEPLYAEKEASIRPHSRLGKEQAHWASLLRQQQHQEAALGQAERRLARRQRTLEESQQEIARLRQRLEQFEQDNRTNPAPIQAVFRLDAGFGTPENVALLIEMGYELYSKPHGNWLIGKLKHWADEQSLWQKVGENAEMTAWKAKSLTDFPYPLDVALERFSTGQQIRQSGLIHFGEAEVTQDLPGWFQRYNQRQTIEAGNKEEKGVFELRHLKVRSLAGIQLQEHFVAFAANFIRWATLWLTQDCLNLPEGWLDLKQPHIKDQVKIGAHSLAWVNWQEQGYLLRFDDHSIFAGRPLKVKKQWSIQLVLPFAKSCFFSTF
jgi:hypothetical protein